MSLLKQSNLVSQPDIKIKDMTHEATSSPQVVVAMATKASASSTACPSTYNCKNGGTCVLDVERGPRCLCTADFTGLDCSTAKFCPDIKSCTLTCDFGYEKKDNCELCKCNCVNENNYFEEVKSAFAMITNSSALKTSKFCQKTCKFGYLKDEQGCYKCSCIESSVVRMGTTSTLNSSEPSASAPTPNSRVGNLTDDICAVNI